MSRSFPLSSARAAASLLVGLLLFSSCVSGDLLSPDGVSGEWLAASEETAPPTEEEVLVSSGLRTALSVLWPNDVLSVASTVTPEEVVAVVWESSEQVDRFVQASRSDLSMAVADIRFPELVPESVEYVSTQLVYLPRTGELDSAPAAAFGLWTVEPYSLSRSVGRRLSSSLLCSRKK